MGVVWSGVAVGLPGGRAGHCGSEVFLSLSFLAFSFSEPVEIFIKRRRGALPPPADPHVEATLFYPPKTFLSLSMSLS